MGRDFQHRLRSIASEVETALAEALQGHIEISELARPERLMRAIRHGALNGGKRLRPFLLIEVAGLFGVEAASAMNAACALECIHCYSLIHDDLPAMDNDDMRRGKPTVHKAYDEATAILAGDALLTLAFDLLSRHSNSVDAESRIALILSLSRAAGLGGMIGGQMLDMAAATSMPDEAGIKLLQSMKTGALIRYACEAGAIIGLADEPQKSNLVRYGEIIGLAFQLADDLLDVTATQDTLGKATGKDQAMGKSTLVGLYGVEAARQKLDDLIEQADASLVGFDKKADILRQTTRFVINREN